MFQKCATNTSLGNDQNRIKLEIEVKNGLNDNYHGGTEIMNETRNIDDDNAIRVRVNKYNSQNEI